MIYANGEKNISKIVDFCMKTLEIDLSVNVEINITDLGEDEGVLGWCYNFDDCFQIELDCHMSELDTIVTLCHEMVHIRQWSSGGRVNEREAIDMEMILARYWQCDDNIRSGELLEEIKAITRREELLRGEAEYINEDEIIAALNDGLIVTRWNSHIGSWEELNMDGERLAVA